MPDGPDIPSLRFLVVEDHGFQRWLICDLLQQLGARAVESASDGEAALQLLAAGSGIDVVVSDLDMPGIDGMRLIRHMGERRHGMALVVVSAADPTLFAAVEAMAREYGVNILATIEKPLTARRLQAALEKLQPPRRAHARSPDAATPEEIAVALERGEFEAFFQPQVEIRTRRTVGA